MPTAIPEILIIEPKVFGDELGFFFESFNQEAFELAVGRPVTFVQDNHSKSSYYTPEYERSIFWNDTAIAIEWPIQGAPTLSAKDQQAKQIETAEHFA